MYSPDVQVYTLESKDRTSMPIDLEQIMAANLTLHAFREELLATKSIPKIDAGRDSISIKLLLYESTATVLLSLYLLYTPYLLFVIEIWARRFRRRY